MNNSPTSDAVILKNLVYLLCLFALIGCKRKIEQPEQAKPTCTLEGQIFIRTKGAETIKLSVVDVAIYDEKTVAQHVGKLRKQAEPLLADLLELEKKPKEEFRRILQAKESARIAYQASQASPPSVESKLAWLNAQIKESEAAISISDSIQAKRNFLNSGLYYFESLAGPLETTKTDAEGKFSFQVPSGSYVVVAVSKRTVGKKSEYYHWMVKARANANTKVMLANDNLTTSGSPESMVATFGDEENVQEVMIPEARNIQFIAAFVEREKQDQEAAAKINEDARQTEEAKQKEQQMEAARQRERAAGEAKKKEEERQAKADIEMQKKSEKAQQAEEGDRQDLLAMFRKNPDAAQRYAVGRFPELGIAGSPLNKEYIARLQRYQHEKKEFFTEPDWPLRLAKECDADLKSGKVTR